MTALLLTSHSPQDTARYAAIIAAELRPRDVLLLAGDLGARQAPDQLLALAAEHRPAHHLEPPIVEVRHHRRASLAGATDGTPTAAAALPGVVPRTL